MKKTRSEYMKDYYKKNKDRKLKQIKNYNEKHKEELKDYHKNWRENNKEKMKEYARLNYLKRKESKHIQDLQTPKIKTEKKCYYIRKTPKLYLTDDEKRLRKNQKAKEYYDRISVNKKKYKVLTPEQKKERRLKCNRENYLKRKQLKIDTNKAIKTINYINDTELYFEVVVSLGKGKMSKKLEIMLMKIVDKLIKKFNYNSTDLNFDCSQEAKLNILLNWQNFNPDRYDHALPYFTELAKRSIAGTYKLIKNKSKYHRGVISLTSFI